MQTPTFDPPRDATMYIITSRYYQNEREYLTQQFGSYDLDIYARGALDSSVEDVVSEEWWEWVAADDSFYSESDAIEANYTRYNNECFVLEITWRVFSKLLSAAVQELVDEYLFDKSLGK